MTQNLRPSGPPRPEQSHPPPQEYEGADADLFDYRKLADYSTYALHSIARRRWLVLLVFAAMTGASMLVLTLVPKSYHCEIKIQAQRDLVISTLAGLSRSWDFELPTRAAADLVLRNDNLISLVRKTDLVRSWETTRAPLIRLKDGVLKRFSGEVPDDVKEETLVWTLEKKLGVWTSEETVTIAIDWPDGKAAYRLIQAAHENFLEARQYKEVSAVAESIGLLQARAVDSRQKVTASLEHVLKLRGPLKKKVKPVKPAAPAVVERRPPPPDPDLMRLRGQLQSKQQVIVEMEEFRRRRIAELASRLAELKQVYSEFHPAVVDLQQSLQQQEREENPQLSMLRQEDRKLQEEYERKGGRALEASSAWTPSGPLPTEALHLANVIGEDFESPEIEQAKAELKHEVSRYSILNERIDQARVELETQRAAFHYRYGVLRPATLPLTPDKPKKVLVVGAGAVMGMLLGFLAALLADLRLRRVLEPWQVARQLGIPVIGEVTRP